MSTSHLGEQPESRAGSRAYAVARLERSGDLTDIPAENDAKHMQVTFTVPEHQHFMKQGRDSVRGLFATGWQSIGTVGVLGTVTPAQYTPATILSHPNSPFRLERPDLTKSQRRWFLEGALSVVWDEGALACMRYERSRTTPIELPGDLRLRLPYPVPDEVWARAKDDLPLVDIPEKPYDLLIRNVDRQGQPGVEEVMLSGLEKVRLWRDAIARFNQLENDHMISLAWWRGYRSRALVFKEALANAARVKAVP